METRLNVLQKAPEVLKPLFAIGKYLSNSVIEPNLRQIVNLRVSQINGCGYCIDMHYNDARKLGESEKRLYGLSAWRQMPWYTDRERAALALAEAVTAANVTDEIFNDVKQHLSEPELIDLTLVITTINTWNRFNNMFSTFPE